MTRKDYEQFAAMFRVMLAEEQNTIPGPYVCPELMRACKGTADIFARDNARFDRTRYLKACGVRMEDI